MFSLRRPALALSLLLCVGLLACKKDPRPIEALSDDQVTTGSDGVARQTGPRTVDEAVDELRANFERVHFAVDSHTLDDRARSALDTNAAILRRFPGVRVEVQGHADRRGTVDYNLALGMRRAASVVDHLRAAGVGSSQLSTVSMGEELPLRTGRTEAAWSVNRRAEFRVLTPGQPVRGTTELSLRR